MTTGPSRMWTVRPLRADDAPEIVRLLAEVAREGRWIATEWPFDVARRAAAVRDAILERRVVGWGAFAGATLLGSLQVHDADEAEPELGMSVAASHRRRGIGRALLDAAIAWGRARGTASLSLRVFTDNAAAIALYRAAGFVEVALERGAIPRGDGTRRDLLRMRRPL